MRMPRGPLFPKDVGATNGEEEEDEEEEEEEDADSMAGTGATPADGRWSVNATPPPEYRARLLSGCPWGWPWCGIALALAVVGAVADVAFSVPPA